MFALWYGTITYQQYKDAIWKKIFKKHPKETAIVSPSRIPIADPSIHRPISPKSSQNVPSHVQEPLTHSVPKDSIGKLPLNNKMESAVPLNPVNTNNSLEINDFIETLTESNSLTNETPDLNNTEGLLKTLEPARVSELPKLEPPPKPPRSPSPHPLRTEAFEEIDYEEEDEDEEVSSGEDDENTVIYSNHLNSSNELR